MSGERFALALGNATGFFIVAYRMLHERHGTLLAVLALAVSACYVLLGMAFRRRVPEDRRALFGFALLSATFLTLAAPIRLGLNGITLCWGAEGVALITLGYLFRYAPVRHFGCAVLALAVGRLVTRHDLVNSARAWPFQNTDFWVSLWVALSLGGSAAVHHRFRKHGAESDGDVKRLLGNVAGLLGAWLLNHEIAAWMGDLSEAPEMSRYLFLSAHCVLWSCTAVAFAWAGLRLRAWATCVIGLFLLVPACLLGLAMYRVDVASSFPVLNLRFGAAAVCVACLLGFHALLRRFSGHEEDAAGLVDSLVWAALAMGLAFLSLECHAWFYRGGEAAGHARWLTLAVMSMIWSVYALLTAGVGLRLRLRPLCVVGLSLLGVAGIFGLAMYDVQLAARPLLILNLLALRRRGGVRGVSGGFPRAPAPLRRTGGGRGRAGGDSGVGRAVRAVDLPESGVRPLVHSRRRRSPPRALDDSGCAVHAVERLRIAVHGGGDTASPARHVCCWRAPSGRSLLFGVGHV